MEPTEETLRAWEERPRARAEPVELPPFVQRALGELKGKKVLHRLCGTGEATAAYLADRLRGRVRVTRLASGLPVGTLVTAIGDGVTLRDPSGLDTAVIPTLDTGAIATVLGGPETVDGYAWYQVDGDGAAGWARDTGLRQVTYRGCI